MKKVFYLIALGALLFASCTKPNDNPNPNEEKTYSFEIGAEKESGGTDETRVEYVDGLMHWSVGDQVGLYIIDETSGGRPFDNVALTGVHTEPTRSTTFSKTDLIYRDMYHFIPGYKNYRYISYYPHGNMEFSTILPTYGAVMSRFFPRTITVPKNEFPTEHVSMFAEEQMYEVRTPVTWLENGEQKWGDKLTFTYKHTLAYLRLRINENLNDYPIDKIKIIAQNTGSRMTTRIRAFYPAGGQTGSQVMNWVAYLRTYQPTNGQGTAPFTDYLEVNIENGMEVGDYIYIPMPPNADRPLLRSSELRRTLIFEFSYKNGATFNVLYSKDINLGNGIPGGFIFEPGKIYDISFNIPKK